MVAKGQCDQDMVHNSVLASTCENQRLACENMRLDEQQKIALQFSTVTSSLGRVEEKLDGLLGLYSRVKDLELWKARLNGRAEEIAANAAVRTVHHREGESEEHIHQRTVNAVLAVLEAKQPAPFDITAWFKKNWKMVALAFTPFLLTVIFLSAVAGDALQPLLKPIIDALILKLTGK